MRARLGKGAIPRVRDTLSHRHVEFELPIGERRDARIGDGEAGDETGLPRMFHRQRRRGRSRMSYGGWRVRGWQLSMPTRLREALCASASRNCPVRP